MDQEHQGFALPQVAAGAVESDVWDGQAPQSTLLTRGLTPEMVAARTKALSRRIEDAELGTAVVLPRLPGQDGAPGSYAESLGFPVGPVLRKPFEVGHFGRNKWKVNGGPVGWNLPGGLQARMDVEGKVLTLSAGLILLVVDLLPDQPDDNPDTIGGYTVTAASLDAAAGYTNTPPRFTARQGAPGTWTAGRMHIPIAQVVAPGRDGNAAPIIRNIRNGGPIILYFVTYGPGLPPTSVALE